MPKRSGFTLIRSAGFTLVELLIVISIIAVLSVVGLVSYTDFLKNSRDAKRQSDIKFIQSALEQYFADQKNYPLSNTTPTCVNGTFKIGCSLKSPDGTRVYLNNIPNDPINGRFQYHYSPYSPFGTSPGCNNTTILCTDYCLTVLMEITVLGSGTECVVDSTSSGFPYSVSKP